MKKRNKRQVRQPIGDRPQRSRKNKNESRSLPSVHIFGAKSPSLTVLPNTLLGLFMSPLMAFGGTACYFAIERISQPQPTWLLAFVQFVFGIAFIGLWFYVMWRQCIWQPGITITRFTLVNRSLRLYVPKMGEIEICVDDVIKCNRQPSKLGAAGWWIQLKNRHWIYLQNDCDSAPQLAAHLESR